MINLELEREMLARPVHSLQYMLRGLSGRYDFLPVVVVDGVFGEHTLEAVMLFQREFMLPVTGVVDYRTWELVRNQWEQSKLEQQEPRAVRAFPGDGRSASEGEQHTFMAVPQTMFHVLSQYINGIAEGKKNGIHEGASVKNVRWLQGKAGLPVTGTLDQRTWDALSRLYEVFVLPRYAEDVQRDFGWG